MIAAIYFRNARLSTFLRGQKLNINFLFSDLLGTLGISWQKFGISRQKVWFGFPGVRGTYRTFWPPSLHVEDKKIFGPKSLCLCSFSGLGSSIIVVMLPRECKMQMWRLGFRLAERSWGTPILGATRGVIHRIQSLTAEARFWPIDQTKRISLEGPWFFEARVGCSRGPTRNELRQRLSRMYDRQTTSLLEADDACEPLHSEAWWANSRISTQNWRRHLLALWQRLRHSLPECHQRSREREREREREGQESGRTCGAIEFQACRKLRGDGELVNFSYEARAQALHRAPHWVRPEEGWISKLRRCTPSDHKMKIRAGLPLGIPSCDCPWSTLWGHLASDKEQVEGLLGFLLPGQSYSQILMWQAMKFLWV